MKLNPREKDWHSDSRKFIPREMRFTKKKAHKFAENANFKWKPAKSYSENPQFAKVFFTLKEFIWPLAKVNPQNFAFFFLAKVSPSESFSP